MGKLRDQTRPPGGLTGNAAAVLAALIRALGELRGRRVAVFGLRKHEGLSSGPGGLELASTLLDLGVAVSGWDPDRAIEMGVGPYLSDGALIVDDAFLAALDADALVVTESWPSERWEEFECLRPLMSRPFLLDATTDHPFLRSGPVGVA